MQSYNSSKMTYDNDISQNIMPHLLLQSLLISCVDVMAISFQLSITNNTLYSRGAYMYATD